jgi:hypothetical protein
MQDITNLQLSRRGSFIPLAASIFALSGVATLFSPARQRQPQVSVLQQPLKPNYVELNGSDGIIFEREGYPAIAARLYIDTNTSHEQYPSTRLQLTSLLDVNLIILMIGRRTGKTKR